MLPTRFYSLITRLQQQQQQQFASPDRPAFATILLSLSSAFAFMLPFHGFYSLINCLQQQKQQQISSPHHLAFAIVRFRIHVALSRIYSILTRLQQQQQQLFIALSPCSCYRPDFIQLLLGHNNNNNKFLRLITLLSLLSCPRYSPLSHSCCHITRQQQQFSSPYHYRPALATSISYSR